MKRVKYLFVAALLIPWQVFAAPAISGSPANATCTTGNYTAEANAEGMIIAGTISFASAGAGDLTDISLTGSTSGTVSISAGTLILDLKHTVDAPSNRLLNFVVRVLAPSIPVGTITPTVTVSGTMAGTQIGCEWYSIDTGAGTVPGVDATSSKTQATASSTSANFRSSFTVANSTVQIVDTNLDANANSTPTGSFTENKDGTYSTTFRQAVHSLTTSTGSSLTYGLATISTAASAIISAISYKEVTAGPTFTGVPAFSSNDTTHITFSYTLNQTGTVKGVAVASGASAPSVAQVKAGQDSTSSAAIATLSDSVTASVADTGTFTLPGAPGLFDFYFVGTNANGDTIVKSVIGAYEQPAYDSGLSLSAATTDGGTIGWDADAATTSYLVAVIQGSTTPTCTQIKAGQNGSGSTALSSGNKSTGTSADTLTLTGVTPVPVVDYHGCLHNTGGDSAVSSLTNQLLTAPAGKQFVRLTSISSTSWCQDFNDVSSPDIAATDIVNIDLATTPTAFGWTQSVDCNGSYSGDASWQKLVYNVYSMSGGAYISGGPGTLWFNYPDPELINSADPIVYAVPLSSAMTAVDLLPLATDPAGDVLVATASSLPTGLSVTASSLGGTATVQGIYSGVTLHWTNIAGAVLDSPATIIVGNVTIPNVANETLGAALSDLDAVFLNGQIAGLVCSASVPAGSVVSYTPTGSVAPLTNVALTLSRGLCRRQIINVTN